MNDFERDFNDRMTQLGFTVLRNGWPDFLCMSRDGGFAVELKRGQDRVSAHQKQMHEALKNLGVAIVVARPEDLPVLERKRGRKMARVADDRSLKERLRAAPACSFCNKQSEEVERLIAGRSVWICNECVELCNDIIDGDRTAEEKAIEDRLRAQVVLGREEHAEANQF